MNANSNLRIGIYLFQFIINPCAHWVYVTSFGYLFYLDSPILL